MAALPVTALDESVALEAYRHRVPQSGQTYELGKDTNVTGNLSVTGGITSVDSVQLDLAAAISVSQGELAWNADEETADLGLNGAVLQLGQEVHYHVRNNSGSLIPDGTAVMATGSLGASGRITIGLMDGSSIANAKLFLGVTTEDIANGTDGKVTAFGKVRGIKTDYATWADGDVLWIDNASPGDLTNVQPTSGSRLPIAFIVHAHATNGTIAVRATDGTYLMEAHDTQIASPATGEVLQYNGTVWVNAHIFERRDIAFTDETSDLTTGDAKATFHMPNYATTLLEVSIGLTTAPTGSIAIFDLEEGGTTVLSTLISIDIGEKTSEDAATPPVISDSALAANALMTVNIDQIGSSVAGAGAKLYVKYKRA